MNANIFYTLLLCFASGFTQCLLIGCFVYLVRRRSRYQFHRSFSVVLLMLSVGFLNNFIVSACQDSYAAFINTLLVLYDYMIVGGFMVFVVTLVFPGRYSARRLALFEVPYLAALLLFAITRSAVIYPVVQVFTLTVSTVMLVWLGSSIRKYNRMLRDNVGNIECFDLRWAAILIVLLYFVQLVWAAESFSQQRWFTVATADNNLQFDTLWCIITMCYVLLILRKITQQQVFVVPAQEENKIESTGENADAASEYYKVLADSDIDSSIKVNKYYMDTTLTLQKLATHLGTNRQYLSNYINREKQKTFYEYINDFRLDEAKNLLDHWDEGRHHSMEDVAALSGFNSYSTFLRSFVRRYGISPSRYIKNSLMR